MPPLVGSRRVSVGLRPRPPSHRGSGLMPRSHRVRWPHPGLRTMALVRFPHLALELTARRAGPPVIHDGPRPVSVLHRLTCLLPKRSLMIGKCRIAAKPARPGFSAGTRPQTASPPVSAAPCCVTRDSRHAMIAGALVCASRERRMSRQADIIRMVPIQMGASQRLPAMPPPGVPAQPGATAAAHAQHHAGSGAGRRGYRPPGAAPAGGRRRGQRPLPRPESGPGAFPREICPSVWWGR